MWCPQGARKGLCMKKINDIITDSKLYDYFKPSTVEVVEAEEPKCKNKALKIFAIIGVIAAVAGIAYALYRYFKPDYLEDYEDDFEDDLDDSDDFEED